MVPEERGMSMDNMMCMPAMGTANTRCVMNITKKNGELVREICEKVRDLTRFVTATEGENGKEPEINCLLDDLEVQNAIMCRTIEQLDSLIDAMYTN